MRKRLFVDCDDTLILYDTTEDDDSPNPYGYLHGQPYRVNAALVEFIKAWAHDNPCSLVVVWSGGGAKYARTIADLVLPGVDVAAMLKDKSMFDLVRSGDIVVDDQGLNVAARVFKPDEWRYDGSE